MRSFFIQSFGCRASQADGDGIAAALELNGLTETQSAKSADLVILNTCTVTASADVDARRVIRNTHRDAPAAKILVTGCYAQRDRETIAAIEGVEWVVGNFDKHAIPEIIGGHYHGGNSAAFHPLPVGHDGSRTRPNLKVQDGCGNRCAFCIIPAVRGRSRSAPLNVAVEQARQLARDHAEIVLTGINLGRWGVDLAGKQRFEDLLRALLNETDVRRIRISSVEPMDWSEDLIQLMAESPRIAKHAHMPLQSGSDAVLKRMRRKYRIRHYASRLNLISKHVPGAAIGADVITGFPGETDADFQATVGFIEDHPFTYLHVFTYSEREGTEATALGNPVPMHVRRERTEILRALSVRKNAAFRQALVGSTVSAVTLRQSGLALTSNFVNVEMSQPRAANQIVDLKLAAPTQNGMREESLLRIF